MNINPHKKYKRPKQKTLATTNPEAPRPLYNRDEDRSECPEQVCPLQAKDSEWVDILQSPFPDAPVPSSSNVGDDEAVLQLVECEDGPQMKPLAIMFPGLLERDPQTLEGMLTKAMSTTEVTRHLVDLGEKANFTFMKRANRLIPRDKQWLESLAETSNSHCSLDSSFFDSNNRDSTCCNVLTKPEKSHKVPTFYTCRQTSSSDYAADGENAEEETKRLRKRKRLYTRELPSSRCASTTRDSSAHNTVHSGNPISSTFTDDDQLNSEKNNKKAWRNNN